MTEKDLHVDVEIKSFAIEAPRLRKERFVGKFYLAYTHIHTIIITSIPMEMFPKKIIRTKKVTFA